LEPAFDPPGLLEPDFGRLVALGPAVDFPSGTVGKQLFWCKSWPAGFWSQILLTLLLVVLLCFATQPLQSAL